MDSIDRILNFINSTDTEQVQEEQTQPAETQQTEPPDTEQLTAPKDARNEMREQPLTDTPKAVDYNDERTYKSILRKANNVIKKNRYPAVVSVNGANTVFNSGDDLKNWLDNLKSEHREYNKNKLADKINNYKHFNEEYTQDINDIEEDGIIYKKGNIKAVMKDNKRYKVPSTNTKDRKQIYNKLKSNKKVLTDLVKSKDNDEFNNISLSNIDNDGRELIEKHKDNTINNDKTWTRDEFIKMMTKLMEKQGGQHEPIAPKDARNEPIAKPKADRPKLKDAYFSNECFTNTYYRPKPTQNTPGGLNPFLLSPRF